MYSQIVLPPPDNAGSWIRPTKTTVINWTGSIIWPGSPRNHIMVLEHGYFKWVQTGASGGTLILAVEDMDPYLPYLKSHMPDKKLWRDFGRWKSDVVKYFMLCRELVETIIYISEQRTGAEIVNPYEVLAEGLDWGFVSNIYRMSTAKYGVDAGRMSEFRQYGIYPWTYRDCGLRELGYQGPLMPTLVPIGYHHDNDVLEKWRAIHCELVTTKPFEEQAEKLGIEYQRLTEIAGSIRQPIGVEIERKVFDRGRCPACP